MREYGSIGGPVDSFIELGMVGESYQSTSWRSGPLSIVSSQKKVEHVNTGEEGSSGRSGSPI